MKNAHGGEKFSLICFLYKIGVGAFVVVIANDVIIVGADDVVLTETGIVVVVVVVVIVISAGFSVVSMFCGTLVWNLYLNIKNNNKLSNNI